MVEAPSPPYIPAKYHGGYQGRIDRIVIHSTVSGTYVGAAEDIARYFQHPTYVSSAHYAVDPELVYQMVHDNTIAWHDGVNTNSLGIEMCEYPKRVPGRWLLPKHKKLLRNTAKLVRKLCLAYGVPMRKITPEQAAAGWRGICGHDDISKGFGASNHWDPGWFPWSRFIRLITDGSADAPSRSIYLEDYDMQLTPGEWMCQTLTAPGDGYELVINKGYTPITVHKVAFIGRTPAEGVNWQGVYGEQFVDPARPLTVKCPADAVSVEITYTTYETKHLASAGFRPL